MGRKEKKHHYIYKTTDTRNGNFYIGMHSTDNLNDGYIGSGDRLRKLIYKHGKDIFTMEILEFLPNRITLKEREREIVNSDLLKEDKCMNLRIGGEGGIQSEEHHKKMIEGSRKHQLKKWGNHEYRKKISEHASKTIKKNHENGCYDYNKLDWTGKKHKEETKIKIGEKNSAHQKGKNNSQFGTIWITNGIENKKLKKDSEIPKGWYKGRK